MSTTDRIDLRARVIDAFTEKFGEAPAFVARAPGRVNLLGDHTDYNDGFVLPMAIDRAMWIAGRARRDAHVQLASLDVQPAAELDLGALTLDAPRSGGWTEYVRGMAWALRDTPGATTRGWNGVASGDVPIGAGLSSSAALELAVARACCAAGDAGWDPVAMALAAQRAENVWVGVQCGIMDQMISAAGVADHALLIDCRSNALRAVAVPSRTAVVVLDTMTRRGLVDSAYNERRAQCEAAAAYFGVRALRDVDIATFEARAGGLDAVTRRRARHVITENARTLAAADALERGDVERVGRLMTESHASLRDDFEVSRRELDVIVELAHAQSGCWGARMTGAGFGGCAVALVERDAAPAFVRAVGDGYATAIGRAATTYVCRASDGASCERLD